jgi:hypothetical protein
VVVTAVAPHCQGNHSAYPTPTRHVTEHSNEKCHEETDDDDDGDDDEAYINNNNDEI